MSLVQAFIHYDFVLVCSDQKLTSSEGDEENFRKVHKINNHTIFGHTGSLSGNYSLFQDFCRFHLTPYKNLALPFNKIVEIVTNKFNEMNNNMNDVARSNSILHSVICGWDGNHFVGHSFRFRYDQGIYQIDSFVPRNDGEIRIINCGKEEHLETIKNILNSKHGNITIQSLCKSFYEVLNIGVKLDPTINNKPLFEVITRGDI